MPNTRRSKDQVQEKSPGLSLRKKSTNEAKDVSVARKATHEIAGRATRNRETVTITGKKSQDKDAESSNKSKTAVTVSGTAQHTDQDKGEKSSAGKRLMSTQRESPRKRPKLDEGADTVLTPRRSSRAVVPNTRYKDMVDPRRTNKTPGARVSSTKPGHNEHSQKVNKGKTTLVTTMGQESEEVTEEVVTEETRIDTIAQMSLMDDTLILPAPGEQTSHVSEPPASQASRAESAAVSVSSSSAAQSDSGPTSSQSHLLEALSGKEDGQQGMETVISVPTTSAENESDSEEHTSHVPGMPVEDGQQGRLAVPQVSVSNNNVTSPSPQKSSSDAGMYVAKPVVSNQLVNTSLALVKPGVIVIPSRTMPSSIPAVKEKQKTYVNANNISGCKMVYKQVSDKGRTRVVTIPAGGQREGTQEKVSVATTSVTPTITHTESPGKKNKTSFSESKKVGSSAGTGLGIKVFSYGGSGQAKVTKVVSILRPKVISTNSRTVKQSSGTVTCTEADVLGADRGSITSLASKQGFKPRVEVVHTLQKPTDTVATVKGNKPSAEHAENNLDDINKDKSVSVDEDVELDQAARGELQGECEGKNVMLVDRKIPEAVSAGGYTSGNTCGTDTAKKTSLDGEGPVTTDSLVNSLCQVVKYDGRMKDTSDKSVMEKRTRLGRIETATKGKSLGCLQQLNILGTASTATLFDVGNFNNTSQTNEGNKRVLHGYIDYPGSHEETTQIVEISPDLFSKEVYGETANTATQTGETVSTTETVTVLGDEDEEQPHTEDCAEDSVTVSQTVEAGAMSSAPVNSLLDVMASDGHTEGSSIEQVQADVIRIEGLDLSQLEKGTVFTLEKMDSGDGESYILHAEQPISSSQTTEATRSQKAIEDTSNHDNQNKVKVSGLETKVTKQGPVVSAVKTLPDVKITPVRAYSEARPGEEGEAHGKSASITTQTEDSDSESEEEPIEIRETESGDLVITSRSDKAVKRGRRLETSSTNYVIVKLPEGSDVKQQKARPMIRGKLEEPVTMDADGMYICVDCDHKTDRKSNWFKHRRKHLGIKPHACTRCSYRAATSSNLKRHMQIHDDIRNFHCDICGLNFRQKIHLIRHYKYKHEEKKVNCPLCDYQCSSENPDLKIHIRRRHMPVEGSMEAFTCDTCGLMTVSRKDLKQHMKFHKKGPELKLFCEHCSFVTDCMSRLRRHLCVHTKERPFQCGLCPYRASQKEHVLRHMRSQHNVEVETRQKRTLLDIRTIVRDDNVIIPKDGQVDQAAKSSKYRQVDPGSDSEIFGPFEKSDYSNQDKIFACNHCSMKFARLINLYKHLYAQHAQVMPSPDSSDHQCVVCDYRTSSKKNLLVHMRKHNLQDHSPPTHVYSCVLCKYINPRRRNLFQHMKKKHGIEIVMKEDGLNCFVTIDSGNSRIEGQPGEANEIALSEIVKTEAVDGDAPLQIMVGEDGSTFSSEKICIDNYIPIEDMSQYVSSSEQQETLVSPQVHTSVQEHEAAEAIEGLQALAEQAGVQVTQNIDNDMTSEITAAEIMNDGQITIAAVSGAETVIQQAEGLDMDAEGQEYELEGLGTDVVAGAIHTEEENGKNEDIHLSSEELNQLSAGDYVEINGEVYKVEIAG